MISRRQLVVGGAALFGAPAILRAQSLWRHYPFSLGVAAGDPAPDGFVIWTRIAPEPLSRDGGVGIGIAMVKWQVASDDRFRTIVAQGEAPARPELAHSVHVEVAGLQAGRPYWYRFEIQGERSPRGHARTLPAPGSSPTALRFAAAGCQHYEDGFFSAYAHMAREELAFVYHSGDYIYEYGGDAIRLSRGSGDFIPPPVRHHQQRDLFDVDDYRRQYALYKMDEDLQRAHAAHAFFHTIDDHEVMNNWAGDLAEDDTPPEVFRLRRMGALQAWYEHMPVRRRAFPGPDGLNLYRGARFGDLADLSFLDTRQYRTDQPCGDGFRPVCAEVRSTQAAVIGAEQETWLNSNLARGGVRWNVIAQQIMMMSIDRRRSPEENDAKVVNMDTWAGYEVPRRRLIGRMRGLDNVVILTGDEHQNWAGTLHDERDRPVAIEFVASSISSGGDGRDRRNGSDHILASNPQLKFVNDQRGFQIHEVGRDAWTTKVMVMDKVRERDGAIAQRAALTVARGETNLAVA